MGMIIPWGEISCSEQILWLCISACEGVNILTSVPFSGAVISCQPNPMKKVPTQLRKLFSCRFQNTNNDLWLHKCYYVKNAINYKGSINLLRYTEVSDPQILRVHSQGSYIVRYVRYILQEPRANRKNHKSQCCLADCQNNIKNSCPKGGPLGYLFLGSKQSNLIIGTCCESCKKKSYG